MRPESPLVRALSSRWFRCRRRSSRLGRRQAPQARTGDGEDQVGTSGGKAPIYGTVPVTARSSRSRPGRASRSPSTSTATSCSNARRSQPGPGDAGIFKASIIVRKDGKYAAAAHLPASGSLRGDTTVRKSWRVSFPSLARAVRPRRQGLQTGDGEDGLRLRRRLLLQRPHRPRGARLPQGQRDGAQRTRRQGRGASGSSAAAAATASATPRPASTPRCRSTSRCSSSARATSRSRSTRSRPASPRPRRSPASTASTGANRATTRRACTTPSTGTTATPSTATPKCPNYAASHGCVRTYIADQPRIYDQLHYGEPIFVF